MRVAVGIDTGLRACGLGIADAETGQLQFARLVPTMDRELEGAEAWEAMANSVMLALCVELNRLQATKPELLAVERQAIRGDPRRGLLTKNPSHMLELAAVAGGLLVLLPARAKLAVWPQSWNGNKSKEESTKRVWGALSLEERMHCTGAHLVSSGHNVIDAAGIAKWAAAKWREDQ